MKFEIELKGPLTKTEFQNLYQILKKNGQFIRKWNRKSYVFYTNDKTLDIKVRTTNKTSEIVAKKGFWGNRKREEIIIPINEKSVVLAIKFLAALGYKKGIITSRLTHIFEYNSIEFALVKCPKNYYFYEAEFIPTRAIKNPEAYIEKTLKSLGMKVWSEKEVYNFLMYCNKNIDKHFSVN
jgi:hypothetical protein